MNYEGLKQFVERAANSPSYGQTWDKRFVVMYQQPHTGIEKNPILGVAPVYMLVNNATSREDGSQPEVKRHEGLGWKLVPKAAIEAVLNKKDVLPDVKPAAEPSRAAQSALADDARPEHKGVGRPPKVG